jgi:toxin-antitoxin system PIN domain toxin
VIALDTNLLIYAHRSGVPEHAAAKRAIERALNSPRGCGICWPSLAEFWAVVTHPSAVGGPASPADAERYLRHLLEVASIPLWLPGAGLPRRILQTAVQMAIRGRGVFDLQIALIAMENGADEIWTHDQGFVRIRGLRVYDPLV